MRTEKARTTEGSWKRRPRELWHVYEVFKGRETASSASVSECGKVSARRGEAVGNTEWQALSACSNICIYCHWQLEPLGSDGDGW